MVHLLDFYRKTFGSLPYWGVLAVVIITQVKKGHISMRKVVMGTVVMFQVIMNHRIGKPAANYGIR